VSKQVSIIIRTKNEERWISSCLFSVFSQDFKNFEIILVDNASTDKTCLKAKQFDVKIVSVSDFLPGKAINIGIENSTGKYICCLSGHCIPTNNQWLSNLVRNLESPNAAGVYGRQQPLSFSHDLDKRDLLIAFGLDRKVQKKDPFFHNANSMIKRSIWEKIPFDDKVTNIEDRIWSSQVLKAGYEIIYDPEASVYHYHGIHQNHDRERCKKTVRILETLEEEHLTKTIDINKLTTVCIIPVRGSITYLNDIPLLQYTIDNAVESKYVSKIVLASDNPEYFELVKSYEKFICISRPQSLSSDFVEIEDIMEYAINELEQKEIIPNLIVYMSINYPFRPDFLIDNIITMLVEKGFDSVLPTLGEYRSCWKSSNGDYVRIDEGFIPSRYKQPIHIGISGLGMATYTDNIRKGERLGPNVGLYELDDFLCSIDVGKYNNMSLAEKILQK